MSSLCALLHDDADRIVVSASRIVDGKTRQFNRFARNCERADEVARQLASMGQNAYCKYANHDGTEKRRGVPLCKKDHFTGSRAFVIDVDVGHGDGYKTLREAVAALGKTHRHLRSMGLPRPNVYQSTGGGLTMVWVLENVVPAAEWRRLILLFLLLAQGTGLRVDMNLKAIDKGVRYCGPEFNNVNHGAPRKTEVVWFNDQRIPNNVFIGLIDANASLRVVGSPPSTSKQTKFNDRFKVYKDDFQLDLSLVVDDCEVIKDAVVSDGKNVDRYIHWVDLISMGSKNGDEDYGRAFAHQVSSGHPDYDEELVDAKFDSFVESGDKKSITCKRFHMHAPSLCEKCAFYQKVNSPAGIQGYKRTQAPAKGMADTTGEAAPVILDAYKLLDTPYFNSDMGIRRSKRGDEEGNPIVWPNMSIANLELRSLDHDLRNQTIGFTLSSNTGSWTSNLELSPQQMVTGNAMARTLGEQYVSLAERHHKPVQELMSTLLQSLRCRTDMSATRYDRLGWTQDNKSFVLGSWVYKADGSKEMISSPTADMRQFDRQGDYADYRNTVATIFDGEARPEAHAFIAGSLAAPLTPLLGSSGLALNFYSPSSGFGKTTLSQLAGSLWGSPRTMTVTLDDTEGAIIKRLSNLNNLPVLHDEMRIDDETKGRVINLLFRLTSNVEKSRLHATAQLQERGFWKTLALFSTNYPFTELVRADRQRGGEAAVARVLDFQLTALPVNSQSTSADVSMAVEHLDRCAGWVGHEWAMHIALHRVEIITRIRRVFDTLMASAHSKSNDTFARNHCAAGAMMVVSAQEAQKEQICPLDHRAVMDAVRKAIENAKFARAATRVSNDPINAVRHFLREHEQNRIVVIRGNRGLPTLDVDHFTVRMPAVYEVNVVEQKLYIDMEALERWLMKVGYAAREVMERLAKWRNPTKRSLGEGTKMRGPAIKMLAIPPIGPFKNMFVV